MQNSATEENNILFTERVLVRMTPQLKEAIAEQGKQLGMKPSTYIRFVLSQTAKNANPASAPTHCHLDL